MEKVVFGSKEYMMGVYDMKEAVAEASAKTVAEVIQYATDHPHMTLSCDWVSWGSNVMGNVQNAGDLPYRLIKEIHFMTRRWAEVQEMIAGQKK